MSRQPTITEAQLENLAACLATTVPVLNELDNAFGSPFILPISNTIGALINLLQNVKQNKKECARLAENIYKVLYGIINLHITSEPAGSLSPAMINDVGRFMKYLPSIS
ncbi:hypothetical protein MSAN_00648100 [Mycena sanguinolenta]|uniref:Uncharacterized protein n=1 Tax=Mycena sanguinolenta TaxID=230812 RepID=A0A8H6Z6K5_9AGAR|nr:hypothetical protein MSAN_00648100 [Mycena sanguinolenta]